MTKAAALELAKHGVRVNSIHPGMIDTPMMTEVTDGDKERFQRIERTVPMGRVAAPEEVARSRSISRRTTAAYSTGTEFIVDGGVDGGLDRDREIAPTTEHVPVSMVELRMNNTPCDARSSAPRCSSSPAANRPPAAARSASNARS